MEAVVDEQGSVHLLEPVALTQPRRALVTILEEPPTVAEDIIEDSTLLSEAALAEDWDRAEEDAAWSHLQ